MKLDEFFKTIKILISSGTILRFSNYEFTFALAIVKVLGVKMTEITSKELNQHQEGLEIY